MEQHMTTFGEQLAAAREARPTKDVPVILDGEIAREKEFLLEELKNADDEPRLGFATQADAVRERLEALDEAARDSLVTLRFTRLPGRAWTKITSRNPVRVDVAIDRHYGYNVDAVVEQAARYRDEKTGQAFGHRLEDDEPVGMSDSEWDELYDILSGRETSDIRDAVWGLNEFEPQQRIQALVKASGAAVRSVND